jgi:hypothetical protein
VSYFFFPSFLCAVHLLALFLLALPAEGGEHPQVIALQRPERRTNGNRLIAHAQ